MHQRVAPLYWTVPSTELRPGDFVGNDEDLGRGFLVRRVVRHDGRVILAHFGGGFMLACSPEITVHRLVRT